MFSFKLNKKTGSVGSAAQAPKSLPQTSKKAFIYEDDKDEEEPDFIDGLDGTRIVSKNKQKKPEKKQLVIPLITKNEWRIDAKREKHGDRDHKKKEKAKKDDLTSDRDKALEVQEKASSNEEEEDSLKQQAIKELLDGVSSGTSSDKKSNSRSIPLLFQNRIPEGYEEEDNMDVSLRPDQSTLDDYEEIPIEEFGLAMLHGMGWKEDERIGLRNKKVVDMAEPKLRPKGMGLGAEAAHKNKDVTPKNLSNSNDNEKEDLTLKLGGFALINRGSKKGYYGQIESSDEDNNRLILRLTISGKMEAISKFYIDVVSTKEYKKGSKVIISPANFSIPRDLFESSRVEGLKTVAVGTYGFTEDEWKALLVYIQVGLLLASETTEPGTESVLGKLAGTWEFSNDFMIPITSLRASEWPSKAGLLPVLDDLKQKATGLAALCDVLFFEFVDEFNRTVAPALEEVRRRMEFATSPVREFEEYSYWEHNRILIRNDTCKRYSPEPISAWEFFQKECCSVPSIPLTKDGILQMFSDIAQPGKVIKYKTDGYSHYNAGEPWDIEDFINPLSLLEPLFGLNTNMVLIAPPGAVSSWHLEEARLASYNVILTGLKVWFFIVDPDGKKTPNEMAKLLADTIRVKLTGSGEKFTSCLHFMMSKTYAANPNFFEGTGIQVVTATQFPGQIIYTGVDTFHMVVSIEPTISMAFNVIPVRKDDGRSFIPQLSNVCVGGHGPSGGDIHNGNPSKGVIEYITAGGGVLKLTELYQAAVESKRIHGYRLNGLFHFREDINSLPKKAQLRMAYAHNRYVWSNLTNSTKTAAVFRIVELHLDEDYVVLSTYSEQKDCLVCRPICNVEIYPDLFSLRISEEKTIRVNRSFVPGLQYRPLTDLFADCPLSIVHHGGSEASGSGYDHDDDHGNIDWGSSVSAIGEMPTLVPPIPSPVSVLRRTTSSSSGADFGARSPQHDGNDDDDSELHARSHSLSPLQNVTGSPRHGSSSLSVPFSPPPCPCPVVVEPGPSSSSSSAPPSRQPEAHGNVVGADIYNPGHHDNACKVRVTGFKGICSEDGLRDIFSGIGKVVGIILYGRQKEHAIVIFSDAATARFAEEIAMKEGISYGPVRLVVSSYVRRDEDGKKMFQKKRKGSGSIGRGQPPDQSSALVPYRRAPAPNAQRRGSSGSGATNVFIVRAGGQLHFSNN